MLSDSTAHHPSPCHGPTPHLTLFISWIYSSWLTVLLSNSSSVLIIGSFNIYIFDPPLPLTSLFPTSHHQSLPWPHPRPYHYYQSPRQAAPRYPTLACWLLWIKVTLKTAGARTLWPLSLSVPLKTGDKSAMWKVPSLHLLTERHPYR